MMPDRDEKPSMLQIALDHARKGYRVFPVIPNGKVPSISGWNHRATSDPEYVKKWWTSVDPVVGVVRETSHNVGILCGEDLTVLDIDVKKADGLKAIGEIAETFFEPDWNATRTVRTPSGGLHLYFRTSEGLATTASRVAPGIDTRGVDGYVLAPGSIVNGKAYEVVADGPVAAIEPMLATMIGKPVRKKEDWNISFILDSEPALNQARQYLEQRDGAVQGSGGNDWTYRTAARLKDLGLSQLAALELMLGEWNGKCSPPWSEEELATVVSNAFEYGKRPPGVDSAQADFDPIPDEEIGAETGADQGTTGPSSSNQKAVRTLKRVSFDDITVDFNRVDLVQDWLEVNGMSVLYGSSNVGKTFVAMDMALRIATGRSWAGKDVKQGGVLYVAAEGGLSAAKRLLAAKQDGVKAGPLFQLVSEQVDLLRPVGDARAIYDAVKAMEEETGTKCELVVLDTLSRVLAGGDENGSVDMGALVKNCDQIRIRANVHLMLIHHSGKDAAKGARGHSLLRAATDTEIEIADGEISATKQRDMERGSSVQFTLRSVQVGVDARGREVKSAVVDLAVTSAAEDFETPRPSPVQELLLQAFDLAATGVDTSDGGVAKITTPMWLDAVIALRETLKGGEKQLLVRFGTGADRTMALRAQRTKLVSKGLIRNVGKDQWVRG